MKLREGIFVRVVVVAMSGFLALSSVAYAQPEQEIRDAFGAFRSVLSGVVPVLIGVALLLFLWGLLKYMRAGDDPAGRANGRQWMIWGIVALFAMVAVWGLVGVVGQLTGIRNEDAPPRPELPCVDVDDPRYEFEC